ncbi:MAG: hypothetical protein MUC63_01145 [Planctomycetes bacterium]|nr:hypothetical protein [Planctomycetota bacterium]
MRMKTFGGPARIGLTLWITAACCVGCGSNDPDDPENPPPGFKDAASWSAFDPL